jgi:hypothetical protein
MTFLFDIESQLKAEWSNNDIACVLAQASFCFALGLTMGFLIQGLDILLE